jgi:hypothetical protein
MASTIVNHSCATVVSPRLNPVVTIPLALEPITQLEIAALLSLRARARQLSEQIVDAEASIQMRIEAHAAVEDGEHTAELRESPRRSVAWRVVAERLADRVFGNGKGDGYCERILNATRPSRTITLVVQ